MENVKLLETINQELSTAQVELNHLINAPADSSYSMADPDEIALPSDYASVNVDDLLERALISNAELAQSIYDARIAVQETKKSLLKLLPNLNFALNPQITNNSYWINKHWTDGSVNVSYNLWNILTAPAAKRLAEQNQDLAQKKRMAVQMAVVTQVYIARIQLASSMNVYKRSVDIDMVDRQIVTLTASKADQGAASQAELVAADTAAIVSKLRRYQSMAQFFTASEKLRSTLGLEANLPSVSQSSLIELTTAVQDSVNSWNSGKLPIGEQAKSMIKQ
jgi:outer membrane protein TolC